MKHLKHILLFVALSCALNAATSEWLASVAPILTPAERKAYLALAPTAQEKFRAEFWTDKQITPEEYYRRLQYVDATFGSTKTASGANTDPGRVYLALGPPNRITRLPSSRIFVPLEIWYYETVPAADLTTELRIVFYQKNALGLPKLYSPTLDTVRVLLLPQSSTIGMFGPNDNITESTIRQNLTVGPVEDEVLSASVGVAAGITATGNDELLALVTSPEVILNRQPRTDVKSRLTFSHPKLDTLQTPSSFGGTQVDLHLETNLRGELELQVQQGPASLYQSRVRFNFAQSKPIAYEHRLDLLPGSYTLLFTIDGHSHPYSLEVTDHHPTLLRAQLQDARIGHHAPFEFDGAQYQPDSEGDYALLPVSKPGPVTWVVHRGFDLISKSISQAGELAVWKLPLDLPPGVYKLEASDSDGDFRIDFEVKKDPEPAPVRPLISYNANLAPALRYSSIGRQWLLRGNLTQARISLQYSLDAGPTDAAQIELARGDALGGNLDAARNRVRAVLATQPNNFEALSVFAFIEAKLQDYPIAANLYRRALALQDSPALRQALSELQSLQ